MGETAPTIRRRWLGRALKELRLAAKKTRDQAAGVLDCDVSKISRIESGHRGIKTAELRALLDFYGLTDAAKRDRLVTLARKARTRDWWDIEYGNVLSAGDYRDYLSLESDAAWLRMYESRVVPGLLQTQDYARAIIRAGKVEATEEQIDTLVEVRMSRQSLLQRQPDPLRVWAVLDEAVLRRKIGGREVQREQLLHLVETVRSLPTVTVQVLPFDVGAHAGINGHFMLIGFPEEYAPDVVWLESLDSSLYLENQGSVERYSLVFDHLKARALDPDESLDMISQVAKEL
ncbi:helix-turn-helix domain-containing protein [Carbonactinospora thermoautotrophica]